MTYLGKVVNGVVVFDDGTALPDGTAVRVEPVDSEGPADAEAADFAEEALRIARTMDGLPTDLARNHDHYLHGRPRK